MLNRTLVFAAVIVALIGLPGCKGRKKRKKADPEPVAAAPVQALASDPCDSVDRAHKWSYYPDEPIYFCDRHRHHWVPDGAGGWAHIHEYDQGRPNYAAPMLTNQSEYDIYLRYDEHAAQYPPGSRR